MRAIIKFKENSPYYLSGEKQREVKKLIEVHYNYPSYIGNESTAFESKDTGFTLQNKHIKEIEVFNK